MIILSNIETDVKFMQVRSNTVVNSFDFLFLIKVDSRYSANFSDRSKLAL